MSEPSIQTASLDMPRSSYAMAWQLASYIDCPRRIRSAVLENFERAPTLDTIKGYRAKRVAERDKEPERPDFKLHEGYYPSAVADTAALANERFLEALRRERARCW